MIASAWRRVRALLTRRQRDADLAEEMQRHLELRAARLRGDGFAPEDAARLAAVRFGNTRRLREAAEDAWGWRWLTDLLGDLRHGARRLAKAPVFTTVAITMLALGIGANTTVFSVLNALFLRELPYKDPDRLVGVWARLVERPNDVPIFVSFRALQEWQRHSQSFEQLEGSMWAGTGQTLLSEGGAHRVHAVAVTAGFFSLLGAQATHGRTFDASDRTAGCTIVLSEGFWKERLGERPAIVGESLTLDRQVCTVVGIMPQQFAFYPKGADLWTLITPQSSFERDPVSTAISVLGRLKPNVTTQRAEADLSVLHRQVADVLRNKGWPDTVPMVRPLREQFSFLAGGDLRTALLILFGAVVCVLLIACVNVANLQLARAVQRERELAVCAALGSGRSRLVRQLLAESLLLAILGATLGTGLAIGGVQWFRRANPIELPVGNPVAVSWEVLLFTVGVAVTAGVVSGVMPARKVLRLDLNDVLKNATRGGTSGALAQRATRVLIIAEVAVAVPLLVGAGLLAQSFLRLSSVPLGYRTDHLLTAGVDLQPSSYPDLSKRAAFYDALSTAVSTLPGIEAAAISSPAGMNLTLLVAGRPAPQATLGDVVVEDVSPDFLRTKGIRLLQGRPFERADRGGSLPVAIVNAALVRRYFPNEDPLGRQIRLGTPDGDAPWLTIVGVAGDVMGLPIFNTMEYRAPSPLLYRPLGQSAGASAQILLRTSDATADLALALQRAVSRLDPEVPLHTVRSMEETIAESMAHPRFRAVLLASFAGIALLLAAVGLYGTLAESVSHRTREIGVRMALGAARGHVLQLVIRQGLTLALTGAAIGVAMALAVGRLLTRLLYGVQTTDPATIVLVLVTLGSVAAVASYLPARRATAVDPMTALRSE